MATAAESSTKGDQRATTQSSTTTTNTSSTTAQATTSPAFPRKYPSSSRPTSRRRNSSHSSTDFAPPSPADQQTNGSATTRSASTQKAQRRRLAAALSIPPPATDTDVRPSTSSSAISQARSPRDLSPAASYFALRSNPSGNELRSPLPKRPPASRSSHGIETASGPPPALSTQRSFSIDSWRYIAAEASSPLSPELSPRTFPRVDAFNRDVEGGIDALINNNSNSHIPLDEECIEIHDPDIVPSTETHRAVAMTTTATPQSGLPVDATSKRLSGHLGPTRHVRNDSHSSNEDLFFDLANGEDTGHTVTARRSSRIGQPSHRHAQSQPNAKLPTSNIKNEVDMPSSPVVRDRRGSLRYSELHSYQMTPPSTERSTSVRERPYAASSHPLDSRPLEQRLRSRLSTGNPKPVLTATRTLSSRERSPESPSYITRRQSVTDAQNYRFRNHLQYGVNGNYHSSPLTGRAEQYPPEPSPPGAREGTESSVSTTAPSTVWDELDDLKSRIRKLELTGRLPGAGAASSGSNERPRTATTTVTTMSSSPKRTQYSNTSPTFNSEIDAESLHPLLRSALAKSQPLLTADVYRSLEATAFDALNIAKITNNNAHTATPALADRQLKRRADSLCRSLTELCIALSESKPSNEGTPTERPTTRPVSREASRSRPRSIILDEPRFQRAASLDPEPTSARVLSRLEARRLSLLSGSTAQPSPQQQQQQQPQEQSQVSAATNSTQPSNDSDNRIETEATASSSASQREPPTPTQATLNRTSNVLNRIRSNGTSDETDTTIRPLSRARTELSRRGAAGGTSWAEKRKSREYTSNHPLPPDLRPESWAARDNTSNGVASALPVRRSYFGTATGSAGGSPAQNHHHGQQKQTDWIGKELPSLPNQASQPGTPTAVSVAGIAPGRTARRSYLERSADSTRAIVGASEAQPSSTGSAAENRQKRLSSLGLGGLTGRRNRELVNPTPK